MFAVETDLRGPDGKQGDFCKAHDEAPCLQRGLHSEKRNR